MKDEAISFKDLTKAQLDALKDLYIDSRLDSMSEVDLRKFVKERSCFFHCFLSSFSSFRTRDGCMKNPIENKFIQCLISEGLMTV